MFMDFKLNDQQKMYVETVRRFVREIISPRIMELEKEHRFPKEVLDKAWELGLLNLSLPEFLRGYEVDPVSISLIIKELSYGDTGISTSAMCNELANVGIVLHGSPEQQERFLKPFVEKPLLASFCLTEPNAGSDNSS